ncbi:Low-density receptor-like protein [Thalictrum thalictroides]|uniref:Low-density receptor-like protein n=1 Tax=Thalictrum thalictroides TaxID=46969 RepID=A0A7J6UVP1_THATH|nr:Low-density receptor-like protein [Thalictrum thalictroides]
MATSSTALTITGGSHLKSCESWATNLDTLGRPSRLSFPKKPYQMGANRKVCVRAEYNDDSRGGGGGDFVAGFLLGGAVFGTLAYIFAPQIRRSILNEDEYGFRRAKKPIYYDEGLEKTRQTLNAKISQLNSAIDNVSSRLRGGINVAKKPIEADSEIEATIVFTAWKPSPPMGTGNPRLIFDDLNYVGYFANLTIVDDSHHNINPDEHHIERFDADTRCYNLVYTGYKGAQLGHAFKFGGPGEYDCGL